jgi:uncharacterized membrane protein YbhN (UPF0104 family)
MKKLLKYANLIGSLLSVVALIFVYFRFKIYISNISINYINTKNISLLVILTISYFLFNNLLAGAWYKLLIFYKQNISFKTAKNIFGISQINKYIPGNIFQFAGRQFLGLAQGLNGKVLLQSSVWEIGLLSLTGLLYSLICVGLYLKINYYLIFSIFTISLIISFIAALKINYSIFNAFVFYILFTFGAGILFSILLIVISSNFELNFQNLIFIITAYILAWLIGMLTPGAPAGIGVREVILLFLTNGMIPEAELLVVITLGRLMTITGDFIFYLQNKFVNT